MSCPGLVGQMGNGLSESDMLSEGPWAGRASPCSAGGHHAGEMPIVTPWSRQPVLSPCDANGLSYRWRGRGGLWERMVSPCFKQGVGLSQQSNVFWKERLPSDKFHGLGCVWSRACLLCSWGSFWADCGLSPQRVWCLWQLSSAEERTMAGKVLLC